MSDVVNFTLMGETFITLFVIMDPPGAIPLFLSLTHGRSQAQRRKAAWQATVVALAVIVTFAVFGRQILSYLHITLPALQCAGGLLLLLVALELLTGREQDLSRISRRQCGRSCRSAHRCSQALARSWPPWCSPSGFTTSPTSTRLLAE